MLAAGAAGAEDVGAHVVRVDLHGDLVLDLGRHLDECEGGVTAVCRIEGAEPDQAVHAVLRLEQAVRPGAGDAHRRGLDACFLADGLLDEVDGKAVGLGPAQVHAQQRLGPVLGIGAARAGVHAEQRRVVGVRVAEEQIDLARGKLLHERVELAGQLSGHGLIVGQPGQLARVLSPLGERFPAV